MSINKLALIRYKAINDCLQNRYRKWTLEDLIEKVAAVLYDYEGIATGVSRRTIQADIQLMRSDKLGYNAPIIIKDRKYYEYEDPAYSITKAPINDADVNMMKEIVGVLKQFNGFSYFDEMSDMIARLENNLNKSTNQSANCIQMESNKQVKGMEHIMPLYSAVLNKRTLLIEYKSFKAVSATKQVYFPYLLKEYRNRWFLVVRGQKNKTLFNLALDRIVGFAPYQQVPFEAYEGIDFDRYYNDLLGVTKSEKDRPQKVILFIDKANAPYVITKPLHHSQTVLREETLGTLLRIDVVINFELERELLGFGENLKVIAPRQLAGRIKKRLSAGYQQYEEKITLTHLATLTDSYPPTGEG
ncbi:MAG: WYL domain-containing protein [Taibaiella sp.]|nr:WYL domain-containing protein [Taibaiella sp.]